MDNFQYQQQKKPTVPKLFIFVVVFLTILNISLTIFNIQSNSPTSVYTGNQTANSSSDETAHLNVLQNATLISNFSGNKAFTEIGQKLKINQNSIEIKNQQNCQTPVLPPTQNGCWLAITPGLLGLPSTGVYFRSVEISGDIPANTKVKTSIYNYDSKDNTKELSLTESKNNALTIFLPGDIKQTDTIHFNFWLPSDGGLTISQIKLAYFLNTNLASVSGKMKTLRNTTAVVYLDVNENGKLDKGIDKPWVCEQNFFGTQKVAVDKNGLFELIPDSSCISTSTNQSTADTKKVLPFGMFLLYFENENETFVLDLRESGSSKIELEL